MTRWAHALIICFCMSLVAPSIAAALEKKPVYIGLDAEFGRSSSTAAESIRQGILIALDEINASGGVLGGRSLKLLTKDNRSVPARARQNTKEFAEDPEVVALFCSRFSTVVIETIDLIHKYGLPLLDPWAASDQIVDNGFTPNYVFRLSLRDSWAIESMVKAASNRGYRNIGLLIPNVSWGRGNNDLLKKLAPAHRLNIVETSWFNYGDTSFIDKYQKLRSAGAEALFLITSETEGAALVKEVAALPKNQRLPILSHWSITGSDFHRLTDGALHALDLSVVQTYSFIDAKGKKNTRVTDAARRLFKIDRPAAIVSPVGLAHAYDLTHILARAINKAGTDRKRIRNELEKVVNYDGLIKFYRQPFSSGRHEALEPADVFIARYDTKGWLIRSKD